MQYQIEITRKAEKMLGRIPSAECLRIYRSIQKLANSETWEDVRKLVNHRYGYRLRVGNYRILFDAAPTGELVVAEVKRRDDRTY